MNDRGFPDGDGLSGKQSDNLERFREDSQMLDYEYYASRAEVELRLAISAAHPAAARAHYHLAGYYLDKAYSERPQRDKCPPAHTIFT